MNYTIAQERQKLSAVGQKLITREAAGFRFSHYDEFHGDLVEPAPLVFVHITETNPKNYSSDAAHARAVEAIGISRFPNTGVSYNRLLMQSGAAFEGQPMGRQGAHTVNNKGITTCVSPGCPSRGGALTPPSTNMNKTVRAYAICQNTGDAVTDAELESLAKAIAADQLAGMVKRGASIHGHRCVANKSCPGDKMWARMQALENRVNYFLTHGLKPGVPTTPVPPSDNGEDMPLNDADKKFITDTTQLYAVANNNFTRQVISTATKAILAEINEVDDETAAAVEARLQDDFKRLSDQVIAEAAAEAPKA